MFSISKSKLVEGRVPKRYWSVSLDKLNTVTTKQHQQLRRWVAHSDADSENKKDLLISGQPQTGKTSLGVLVMFSLSARYSYSVTYVDLRTLVECHFSRSSDKEQAEFYQQCLKSDVLLVDDCAQHDNSGCFMALDYVYRARHSANLITILTCDEDETFVPRLEKEFGTKLADKIKQGSLHISLAHTE